MSRKIVVGVSISPNAENLLDKEVQQNAYFIYKLLGAVPTVTPLLVYPPVLAGDNPPETLEVFGDTVHRLDKFYEEYHLDILVLAGSMVTSRHIEHFRSKGVKVARLVTEDRYMADAETTIFGDLVAPEGYYNVAARHLSREDLRVDAVWVLPDLVWQKDYIKYRYGAHRAYVCPIIWAPDLLEAAFKNHPKFDSIPMFKKGSAANQKVFCQQLDTQIAKAPLFSMLATDLAFASDKQEAFSGAHFYNTLRHLENNKNFVDYISNLSVAKAGKLKCQGPQSLPAMIEHAQVPFHHHLKGGLGYAILEAAHLGLPVVHNSKMIPQVGYYYDGASLTDAARQIHAALRHEERSDLESYNAECQKTLEQFSIHNPDNTKAYLSLVLNLLDKRHDPQVPDSLGSLGDAAKNYEGYLSPMV